jgi:hypothetical protein
MKKNKLSGLNEYIKSLPPLKDISANSKLPPIFDLNWDAKTGQNLIDLLYIRTRCNINSNKIYSCLAEHGYDAKLIQKKIINNEYHKSYEE